MKVLKFGGTSIGDANKIRNVVKLIYQGNSEIVVLSALSDITNILSEFIQQVNCENYIVSDQIKLIIKERHLALSTELLNGVNFKKIAQKKITEAFEFVKY